MGDVLVKAASVSDGKIRAMRVALAGLGERTIDRDTAIAWLKDGHSLIPYAGARGAALPELFEHVSSFSILGL